MRQRTHRDVVAGGQGCIGRTTPPHCATPEEYACGYAENRDGPNCSEEPFLVRDEVGHIGEPALIRGWGHRGIGIGRLRLRNIVLVARSESWFFGLALCGTVIIG